MCPIHASMIGGMNCMGLCLWIYISAKSNCGLETDGSPGKHRDHFDLCEIAVNGDETYRHEIEPRLKNVTLWVLALRLLMSLRGSASVRPLIGCSMSRQPSESHR